MSSVFPVMGILCIVDPLLFKERTFLKRQAVYFHRRVKNPGSVGPGEGPCVQPDRQGHRWGWQVLPVRCPLDPGGRER